MKKETIDTWDYSVSKRRMKELLFMLRDQFVHDNIERGLCISVVWTTMTRQERVAVIQYIYVNRPCRAKSVTLEMGDDCCSHYFWPIENKTVRVKFLNRLISKL